MLVKVVADSVLYEDQRLVELDVDIEQAETVVADQRHGSSGSALHIPGGVVGIVNMVDSSTSEEAEEVCNIRNTESKAQIRRMVGRFA